MTLSRDQLVKAFPNQPLMVAEFEQLDGLIIQAQAKLDTLNDLIAQAQAALNAETRWQPASDLLSSIANLDGSAGAVVLTGGGAVTAQPIDTADNASLLSKSRADTLYAPHP